MSKNNKTPFQLKPKHLIRALFLVSFVAVAALVAGVFSTLNPDKTNVPEKSPAEQTDTRIEVWRPNGTVEPETVQPAKDGEAKTASGNPVVPQNEKGEKAEEGLKEEGLKTDRSAVHRSKRTENKRAEADKSENTQSDNSSPTAQNKPKADSQPVENKVASNKPAAQEVENKPEKAKAPAKAEPEAKPQAKPRNKDNLDNLF